MLTVKGWVNVYHENPNSKKAGMETLRVNKGEFRPKISNCDNGFYNAKNINLQ